MSKKIEAVNTVVVVGSREVDVPAGLTMLLEDIRSISDTDAFTIKTHGKGKIDEYVVTYCEENNIKLELFSIAENATDEDIKRSNELMLKDVDLVVTVWDSKSINTKNIRDLCVEKDIPNIRFEDKEELNVLIHTSIDDIDDVIKESLIGMLKSLPEVSKLNFTFFKLNPLVEYILENMVEIVNSKHKYESIIANDLENIPEECISNLDKVFIIARNEDKFELDLINKLNKDYPHVEVISFDYDAYINKRDNISEYDIDPEKEVIDTMEKAIAFKNAIRQMILMSKNITHTPSQEEELEIDEEINKVINEDNPNNNGYSLTEAEKNLILSVKPDQLG